MIKIQKQDFELESALKGLNKSMDAGAVVSFVGVVRKENNLKVLEFESYEEMALEKLKALEAKAKQTFGIKDVLIVHRIGTLKPGDNIVHIAVSSAHRKEAFQACEWIIDELKKVAPIWKKEIV